MKDQAEKLRIISKLNNKKKSDSSNIIAFTSGKGGTGKTFLSLNFAYALAQENRRVLLVDLDFNMSNVELMINMNSDKTINDFLEGRELLPDLVTEVDPNLHLLFGFSGLMNYTLPTSSQIDYLFNSLRKLSSEYDIVLVDTGAGANQTNLSILRNSDHNIIITTPEPTAIMDAYVVIKNLSNQINSESFPVIINKSPNIDEGKNGFEKLDTAVSHFLNSSVEYFGQINYDSNSYHSILEQKVFILEYPESATTNQIFQIARGINKYIQVVNNSQHDFALLS